MTVLFPEGGGACWLPSPSHNFTSKPTHFKSDFLFLKMKKTGSIHLFINMNHVFKGFSRQAKVTQ